MPEINHSVPNFDKAYEQFQKKLVNKKSVHEPIRPKEFNMTKRESEKLKMSLTMNRSTQIIPKAHNHNAQISLANFRKAEESCKSKRVTTTKKFEETVKLLQNNKEAKEKLEFEKQKEDQLLQVR